MTAAAIRAEAVEVLVAGSVASLASSLALLVCGKLENGRALATHNGPSQWVHGTAAGHVRSVSLRYTLTGAVIHHASACWWAGVYRAIFRQPPPVDTMVAHLGRGAVVAVLANIVDYGLMPERFQPGFDKHVSRPSLAVTYAAFGLGLGLAAYWRRSAGLR